MPCDHRYSVQPVPGNVMTGQLVCRRCGDVRTGDLVLDVTAEDVERVIALRYRMLRDGGMSHEQALLRAQRYTA